MSEYGNPQVGRGEWATRGEWLGHRISGVTCGEGIEFCVPGEPVPQGSMKCVGRVGGVAHQVLHSNQVGLMAYRNTICAAALPVRREYGAVTGACRVEAWFYLSRGDSVRRDLPAVFPDLDKVQRAVGDALQFSGLIEDDKLICEWVTAKRYATERAYTRIGVYRLEPIGTLGV